MLGKAPSVLDLGCGQGILTTILSKNCDYLGIDASKKLIDLAKKRHSARTFKVADCTQALELKEKFSAAVCVLALQNMCDFKKLLVNAHDALDDGGQLILVLNHPCFRIPRQSHWGKDEKQKLQYRRIDRYMGSMEIPIQVNPGKKNSEKLISFHHPLSDYFGALKNAGFLVSDCQEWCSEKTSSGKNAKSENRARREFPLFLTICAQKWHK